eukprot:sb/3478479/
MTIYGSTCYTVVVKHVRMCSRTVTFCKMQVLVTMGEIIRLLLKLATIDKTYSTTHLSDTTITYPNFSIFWPLTLFLFSENHEDAGIRLQKASGILVRKNS